MASVSAARSRPTGPAAAVASPPSVNLSTRGASFRHRSSPAIQHRSPKANLESDAATFNPHRGRRAPTHAAVLAAYREPAAILRAEDESGLFHAWHDNHAFRLIDQIWGIPLSAALIISVNASAEASSLSSTLTSLSARKPRHSWNPQLPNGYQCLRIQSSPLRLP